MTFLSSLALSIYSASELKNSYQGKGSYNGYPYHYIGDFNKVNEYDQYLSAWEDGEKAAGNNVSAEEEFIKDINKQYASNIYVNSGHNKMKIGHLREAKKYLFFALFSVLICTFFFATNYINCINFSEQNLTKEKKNESK